MKVKFLRPVQGLAYFEGDVADLPAERAAKLVETAFVILVPDTEGPLNQLPEDFPARELLFDNGLETLADVKNAIPSIEDINGIGPKTKEDIIEYFEK